jgi:hypothetical protein
VGCHLSWIRSTQLIMTVNEAWLQWEELGCAIPAWATATNSVTVKTGLRRSDVAWRRNYRIVAYATLLIWHPDSECSGSSWIGWQRGVRRVRGKVANR